MLSRFDRLNQRGKVQGGSRGDPSLTQGATSWEPRHPCRWLAFHPPPLTAQSTTSYSYSYPHSCFKPRLISARYDTVAAKKGQDSYQVFDHFLVELLFKSKWVLPLAFFVI